MRSYKEILRYLIVREQLSLTWKLALFAVCAALIYGSLTLRDMRIESAEVTGTVLNDRTGLQDGASVEYIVVRLESGETVKAQSNGKLAYRPGRHVVIKQTRAKVFGIKKHEFKRYIDETRGADPERRP